MTGPDLDPIDHPEATPIPDLDDAHRLLKSVFCHPKFRRGQQPIISNLLEGRSARAV